MARRHDNFKGPQPRNHPWKRLTTRKPVYKSPDGRLWIIDSTHPQTDDKIAVCRSFEEGKLHHTAVWSRNDLTKV